MWFEEVLTGGVGNGESTSLCNYLWLEGGHLCYRFSRLFDLCVDDNIVTYMWRLGWEFRVKGGG
jgi:hypothetical protein